MKNIVYNITLGINCLLAFVVLFSESLVIPSWLQVVGRMHPLLLHFPIVLLVIAAVWELFLQKKITIKAKPSAVSGIGHVSMPGKMSWTLVWVGVIRAMV